MSTEKKPVRWAQLRKKNRRIEIVYYDLEDGALITIYTKRLIGNWKDRNIQKSTVGYGMESMAVIVNVLQHLFEDSEFVKRTNRELGQIEKSDKFEIGTNISAFLKST